MKITHKPYTVRPRDRRSPYKTMFPPLLYEALRSYVLVSREKRVPINTFIVDAVIEKLSNEGISTSSLT
jgi:hypothetical protein